MVLSRLALIILLAAAVLAVAITAILFLRRRHRRGRLLYQAYLEQALEDGVLSTEELNELDAIRAKSDISEAETRMVALAVYRRALKDAAADARITEQEDATLRTLQQQLGLSEQDLRGDREQLQRIGLLAQAERGQLPSILSPLPLEPGETAHWVVHGTLCERIALPGSARTEPASQYFPIAGTEPFRASETRSPLAVDPAVMPRDLGVLSITSSATVFRGAKRNVRILHDALRGFALFADGVRLDTLTSESSSYFLVSDPELTGALLLRAARDRRRRTPSRGRGAN
jgi:hypothetical protein